MPAGHLDEVGQSGPSCSDSGKEEDVKQSDHQMEEQHVPYGPDPKELITEKSKVVQFALNVWEKRFKQNILIFLCEKIKIFSKTILFTKDQVPDEVSVVVAFQFLLHILKYGCITYRLFVYLEVSCSSVFLNRINITMLCITLPLAIKEFAEKFLHNDDLLLPSEPKDIFQYRLDILESIGKNQDNTFFFFSISFRQCHYRTMSTLDVACLQVKKIESSGLAVASVGNSGFITSV
ncbi:hypothetical protein ACJMK2_001239 [Sinanodonta woodiana]|uniref:Uncharacterized protein n=1 Tax=Sinanodonta woodiana TaxID=1069815 RepID=A0ABD3XRL5_SINWO